MAANPFEGKNSEEALKMFIESPSDATKAISVYTTAIHVRAAQEIKEALTSVQNAIEKFSHNVEEYSLSSDRLEKRLFWLNFFLAAATGVGAVATVVQAIKAFWG